MTRVNKAFGKYKKKINNNNFSWPSVTPDLFHLPQLSYAFSTVFHEAVEAAYRLMNIHAA